MAKAVRIEGAVVRKRINVGSKSEHDAVVLVGAQGEYTLRRAGGHPFADATLDALVGKRVRVVGIVSAGQFIADDITVLGDV
jgi:hypothetical protein